MNRAHRSSLAFASWFLFLFGTIGRASGQRTLAVPQDFSSIQSAIDAANNGDTVLIAPGTYYEHVLITGKEIILTSSDGPTKTTWDGQGLGTIISIQGTPTIATTVSGFTFTGGYGLTGLDDKSAILIRSGGATVDGNIFSSSEFSFYALEAENGTFTFSHNSVNASVYDQQSFCFAGGGIFATGKSSLTEASGKTVPIVVSQNVFNGASTSRCAGTGLTFVGTGNTYVENNRLENFSLGLNVSTSQNLFVLRQNILANNLSGSMNLFSFDDDPQTDSAHTIIIDNTLSSNLTNPDAQAKGDIYVSGNYSRITIANNIIVSRSPSLPILYCSAAPSSPANLVPPISIDHNLFFGSQSSPPFAAGVCSIPIDKSANIIGDPLFVSSTDFHTLGGPSIDHGRSHLEYGLSSDLDGNSRSQGSAWDIGVYETPESYDRTEALSLSANSNSVSVGDRVTLVAALKDSHGHPLSQTEITFFEAGGITRLGSVQTDANGTANMVTAPLAASGIYDYLATVTPSPNIELSSNTVYVVSAGTPSPIATILSIAGSTNPSPFGSTVTFNVTSNSLDGSHPSPLALRDGSTLLTTLVPDPQGYVSYATDKLFPGLHSINIVYAGDATHASSTAQISETVSLAAVSLVLSASPTTANAGNRISLTAMLRTGATVSAYVPTGTVTFFDGSVSLGTSPILGQQAFLSVSLTSTGVHQISAVFSGDAIFDASKSNSISIDIVSSPSSNGDYSIVPSPLSVSVQSGHSVVIQLVGTPIDGFQGDIFPQCGEPSLFITCTFQPSSLHLEGLAAQQISLTIDTNALLGFESQLTRARPMLLIGLGILLLPFALRRRQLVGFSRLLTLALGLQFGLGCSSHYPASTPPGEYKLTIKAHGVSARGVGIDRVTYLNLSVLKP